MCKGGGGRRVCRGGVCVLTSLCIYFSSSRPADWGYIAVTIW